MQRIWVNLRAPARDNPCPIPVGESPLLALIVFGAAVLILIAAAFLTGLPFH